MPAAKKDKETGLLKEKEDTSYSEDRTGNTKGGPLLPLLVAAGNFCSKCREKNMALAKNGGSIHSTLAYSRCRCHRQWKYYMPSSAIEIQAGERMVDAAQGGRVAASHVKHTVTTTFFKNQSMNKPAQQTLTKRYSMTKKVASTHHLPPLLASKKLPTDKLLPEKENDTSTCTTATLHHPLMNSHKNKSPPFTNGAINKKVSASHVSSLLRHQNPVSSNDDHKDSALNCNNSSMEVAITEDVTSIECSKKKSNMVSSMIQAIKSNNQSSSSIPTLPQIQSSSLLQQPSADDKNADNAKECITSKFEFIHLLKYIPDQQKLKAAELFDILDQNDDGHLTFSEVYSGLVKDWQSSSAKAKFELYLKPLYHTLGEETYFGKRDFVLCYSLAQLFEEYSFVVLSLSVCAVETKFYHNIMKPLLSVLAYCNESGTVQISSIEDAVQKFNTKHNTKLKFSSMNALKLIRNNEDISLLMLLIFAPHLFMINK